MQSKLFVSLSKDKKGQLANEIYAEDIPFVLFDYHDYTLDIDAFTKQLTVLKFYEEQIKDRNFPLINNNFKKVLEYA